MLLSQFVHGNGARDPPGASTCTATKARGRRISCGGLARAVEAYEPGQVALPHESALHLAVRVRAARPGARRRARVRGRRRAPAPGADRRRAPAGRPQGDAARAGAPAREGGGDADAVRLHVPAPPAGARADLRAAALLAHGGGDAQAGAARPGRPRGGSSRRAAWRYGLPAVPTEVLDRVLERTGSVQRRRRRARPVGRGVGRAGPPARGRVAGGDRPVRLGHGARGDHPARQARRLRALRASRPSCSTSRRRRGGPRSRVASRCTWCTARPRCRWPTSVARSGCGATAA